MPLYQPKRKDFMALQSQDPCKMNDKVNHKLFTTKFVSYVSCIKKTVGTPIKMIDIIYL
jgi:hypothetical protein